MLLEGFEFNRQSQASHFAHKNKGKTPSGLVAKYAALYQLLKPTTALRSSPMVLQMKKRRSIKVVFMAGMLVIVN
jgi:hypothetical protein